jgi:hypothetical protein
LSGGRTEATASRKQFLKVVYLEFLKVWFLKVCQKVFLMT